MRGPEIFLDRLSRELKNFELNKKYKIFNSSKQKEILKKEGEWWVARIDGTPCYNFTPICFYNYLRVNYLEKFPEFRFLEKLNFFNSRRIDYLLNKYLNRNQIDLIRQSDLIVYQSQFSKKMFEAFYGPSKLPYRIIHNGVPENFFCFQPKSKRIDNNLNLVITADFRLGKRLAEAIIVVNQLNKIGCKSKLHVIGHLDLLTRESIANLSLENCHLYGKLPYKSMANLYKKMHIGLSPSLFDPCPNSVIEMQANSLPVITTAISGAAELVFDKNLIIEEPKPIEINYYPFYDFRRVAHVDEHKWVESIIYIIDNYLSISQETFEKSRSIFNISEIASQYIEAIKVL